jgi:cytochrome P450
VTNPPGPRSQFPGALVLAFRRDPLGFLERVAREHGDMALIRLGPQRVYLLNHPEHAREAFVTRHRAFEKGVGLRRAEQLLGKGLLTSEGELHRRQRRLVQPAFHHERVTGYAAEMSRCALAVSARWAALDEAARADLDLHREMLRLTLAIVGRTLFASEVEEEAETIGRAVATCLALFQRLATVPFAEVIERLPLPGTRRFRRARAELDTVVHRLIVEHRAADVDRGDFLSMLIAAGDEEAAGARMSDQQLRDEAITILLAGHETTANALAWSCWLLGRHPDAAAQAVREIDDALGDRGPEPADMSRLPTVRGAFAEALRLYPPAWVIGRRATEDTTIGGYAIPRRAIVLVSPYLLHRDARFFADPERFDPGRWLNDRANPRLAFVPFGAGPRICIGEQFAWLEGVTVLATLLRRWSIHPLDVPALEPSITLRPRNGMRVRLERRAH